MDHLHTFGVDPLDARFDAVAKMPEYQRQLEAKKLLPLMEMDLKTLEARRDSTSARIDHINSFLVWAEQDNLVFEKNDCSRLHKLWKAFEDDRVLTPRHQEIDYKKDDWKYLFVNAHSFVIRNDWAAAFKGAQDFEDGAVRFPFDICIFEFRVSGKTCISICFQEPTDNISILSKTGGIGSILFVEHEGYWISGGKHDSDSMHGLFAWEQIRAICIALEAGAAVHEVIRAPSQLNASRTKRGDLPLFDYHVVSLAKRSRTEPLEGGFGRPKRLHFRRGHWRHFETHKTWIKWMLVGNPDLGFIGKEYRL